MAQSWYHADPNLSQSVAHAATLAASGSIRTASQFRAWCVWVAWVDANLRGAWSTEKRGELQLLALDLGDKAFNAEKQAAAKLLATTPEIFARAAGWNGAALTEEITTTADREAGFLPLVMGVVVRLGSFAALAYCAKFAADVADKYLARSQSLQELERTDAQARALIERHLETEQAAGKSLPLDAATKTWLDNLAQRQQSATTQLGAAAQSDTSTFLLLGAAALVGWFMVRNK